MKQTTKVAIAASTVACAALLSLDWSAQRGISLSVESAEARVGRPLTPMSGAGVARRQYRRGAVATGAAVGAGVAAVGTAAAVAATTPWGTGYYPGGPYGQRAWGANAYYAPPATTTEGPPYDAVRAYYARGPWYGYSGWDDYQARNGIKCMPGSTIKLDDGLMYNCQ